MQLLYYIGVYQDSLIQVYIDNQSARALVQSSEFHGRADHIEVHCHFVHELVESHVTNLVYCPSKNNVAD